MDPNVPSQIGRYSVDRLLGSGAMGFVYLGRDPQLDRPVAIKTIRDLEIDREVLERFLDRFRNEARAAARLHHPSIVQVYDVGEDDVVGPYLVFEYVPGATLKQVIRSRGPLPPAELLRIAEQIGDALDAAHLHGIIHRDIKPDNLLITEDGRAKLADFGVARVPNAALTTEGQFLGTPCYAAPETLQHGAYAPASDLFSFAALLFEAVTGARAYPGDDAMAVAQKVVHEDPPTPSAVARGVRIAPTVDAVLLRGLSKNPDDRYASASELARALDDAFVRAGAISEHGARPASQPPMGRRASGPPHQSSNTWVFSAVLFGGLAVGVALLFAFGRGVLFGVDGEYDGSDGGMTAPNPDPSLPVTGIPRPSLAAPDAGGVRVTDESLDAGQPGDPPAIGPNTLSAHEREEAAKDALDRARQLIDRRDYAGARAALEGARQLDPGNPDIAAALQRLP